MPRIELFSFRYVDDLTGKWVKARYVATIEEIARRHAEWKIVGPPEIRDVDSKARSFTPWKIVPHAEVMRMSEPPPQLNPHFARPPAIEPFEAFLVTVFLRRYVTYCARRARYAQMNGAASLLATLRSLLQSQRTEYERDSDR